MEAQKRSAFVAEGIVRQHLSALEKADGDYNNLCVTSVGICVP